MKPEGTQALSGRAAACLAAVLAAWSLGLPAGLRAQIGPVPPVKLPPVIVTANAPRIAPLIKTGEFEMREARYQPAAVAQGDFIYIIGGSSSHDSTLDSVERFNVRTGKSEDFAKLRIGRRGHQAVLIENRIYVLGGFATQSYQTARAAGSAGTDLSFDITAPRVTNPNDLPDPTAGDYARRSLSRLGEDSISIVEFLGLEQSVEVIDLPTRKVTRAADMPDARAQFGCVARGGKIYVIGGQRLYRQARLAHTNTVKIFDPAMDKWSDGVPMPTPRDSPGVLVDGLVIVVPGGYDGWKTRAEVEVFNPGDNRWRILPPLCRPTSTHSLVFLDHYLFFFGDDESPGDLVAYDLAAKLSEVFPLQYKPARHTAAVVDEGKIYVIGGKITPWADALNSIQVFALRSKQ